MNCEGLFGGEEEVPAPSLHNHRDGESPSSHISCTTCSSSGRVCPALWVPPLPVSVCFSLREVLWRRSCCIQASPSLRPFLPLHLCMLAPAVVSCLPKEGRGLHFPDCLAPCHSCIVICYPRSKHMPACKDSINVELWLLFKIYTLQLFKKETMTINTHSNLTCTRF